MFQAMDATMGEGAAPAAPARQRFRHGVRLGVPFALAGFLLSASFGVLAIGTGMTHLQAIVMSTVVFAGSAQFAALSILAGGGTIAAAVGSAVMVNSRFLPMGAAFGPSLPGRSLWRAIQGQAVVDASWAMAVQEDGSFDRMLLFGSTAVQYVTWVTGTIAGVFAGAAMGDPDSYGLDAIYPAFFLALLLAELRSERARGVAALGAAIALALVSFTPAGVPVLVASVAALTGLRRRVGGGEAA
jgi:4-azaleucine resistance transporter AzlC